MHRFTAFYVLILLSKGVYAQILKIDKSHLNTDSSNYTTGIVDVSFSMNNRASTVDDDVKFLQLRNSIDVVYLGEESATIFLNHISFIDQGDGQTISNGLFYLSRVFNRRNTINPESYFQVQYDQTRNMELRELLGGGIRWNILQGDNALHLGVGFFGEHERWRNEMDVAVKKDLIKLNSYIGGDIKLSNTINLNTVNYFQIGHDGDSDQFRSRMSGFIELKDQISRHFRLKIVLEYLADFQPIIPLNKGIYDVYFGLEYKFD